MIEKLKNIRKCLRLRSFVYIYNSRIDFVDFWLCLYIVSTGFVCLYSQPLENISVYTNLTDRGISSNILGTICLSVRIPKSYKTFLSA